MWWWWGVLDPGLRLKPTGGRSGVGIRKHVEPFSVLVQGGSSPPWRTGSAPENPFPAVIQVWGNVSNHTGRRRALRMVTPQPAPRGLSPFAHSEVVTSRLAALGQSDPIFHPCVRLHFSGRPGRRWDAEGGNPISVRFEPVGSRLLSVALCSGEALIPKGTGGKGAFLRPQSGSILKKPDL